MTDLPLPSNDDQSPDDLQAQTEEKIREHLKAEVPQRAYRQYENSYPYLVYVNLQDGGTGHMFIFLHKDRIDAAALQKMVDEAAQVTLETRVKRRRRQLVKQGHVLKKPPEELNATWFETDATFFEGVMMDKFNFRKLVHEGASGTIAPTLTKKGGQHVLEDPGPMLGVDTPEEVKAHKARLLGHPL